MAESFLFVYGTLQGGFGNHHYLQNARFVGLGVTLPRFELLDLGSFPGMVEHERTAVRGEVYVVDDGTLELLDRLEGHPNYFVRTRIALQNDLEVWVYLMRQEFVGMKPRIASGDWREWKVPGQPSSPVMMLTDQQ